MTVTRQRGSSILTNAPLVGGADRRGGCGGAGRLWEIPVSSAQLDREPSNALR